MVFVFLGLNFVEMPITANADYVLTSGASVRLRFSTTKIFCVTAVDKDLVTSVDIQVWNTAGDEFYFSHTQRFTESDLEAEEGAGTGEFTQFMSVVEQAVVTYLEGIASNSSVTFTIV